MTEPIRIRKLSYYMPLAKGTCDGCGKPVVYNLAAHVEEHEEPNPDCPRPSVKVERTAEEEERIQAAEAKETTEARTQRDRHNRMLANATHPVLHALIEAHHPDSDSLYADCSECPCPPSEYTGDPEPQSWPCPVWLFISDRMDANDTPPTIREVP